MESLRKAAALVSLLLVASCSTSTAVSSSTAPVSTPAACNTFLPSSRIGDLRLEEGASIRGAVASRQDPDRLWLAVTGADGAPQVTGVHLNGEQPGTSELGSVLFAATGIGLGPGPDPNSDYLYVVDSQAVLRGGSILVARISEAALLEGGTAPLVDVLEIFLPAGIGLPVATFVDTDSGDLYFVSESRGSSLLLRASAPLVAGRPIALELEAGLSPDVARGIGGASLGPDGNTVALLRASEVALWRRSGDASIAQLMVRPACAGLFADGHLDTVIALRERDLLSIDPSSHNVETLLLPEDVADPRISTGREPGNLAPQLAIVAPSPSFEWETGIPTAVEAKVEDDQPVDPTNLKWELLVHRCTADLSCDTTVAGEARGSPSVVTARSFGLPLPTRVELRAVYADDGGLVRTASVDLQPLVAEVLIESEPSGAAVAVGDTTGVTPLIVDAAVGERLSVEVAPLQSIESVVYEYASWSDGGDRSHEVTIEPEGTALMVVLRPERAHMKLGGNPGTFGFARQSLPSNTTVVDLRAWVALDDWTPDSEMALLGSQGKSLVLRVTDTGRLHASVALAATATLEATSTVRLEAEAEERLWARAVLDSSTGLAMFFVSTDASARSSDVEWTPLGEPVDSGRSGRIDTPIPVLVIGQENRGTARPLAGKVFGAAWFADGRLVTQVDFTDDSQLTSRPPDFSRWGAWAMFGPGWRYVLGAAQ